MRRSGRTTRILINLICNIEANYRQQRVLLFVTHRSAYSRELIKRLRGLYPTLESVNKNTMRIDNTVIFTSSFEELTEYPDKYIGIEIDEVFYDHYRPIGVWPNEIISKATGGKHG